MEVGLALVVRELRGLGCPYLGYGWRALILLGKNYVLISLIAFSLPLLVVFGIQAMKFGLYFLHNANGLDNLVLQVLPELHSLHSHV